MQQPLSPRSFGSFARAKPRLRSTSDARGVGRPHPLTCRVSAKGQDSGDVVTSLEAQPSSIGRLDAALAYAVEPRSWAVQKIPAGGIYATGFGPPRRAGAGQPALIGAALGLRDCIGQEGSRTAIRAPCPPTSRNAASRASRWRR